MSASNEFRISLCNISKRYTGPWIIKEFNAELKSPAKVAISGINGSGKSTLLQMIIGHLTPTIGSIDYQLDDYDLPREEIYKYVSFTAPYADLIDDLTVKETLDYYQKFKAFTKGLTVEKLLSISRLNVHRDKRVKYLSSGLNQRLKLILAFAADTPILVLDEPTSYLDTESKGLYTDWIDKFCNERLVVIASNEEYDLQCCDQSILI